MIDPEIRAIQELGYRLGVSVAKFAKACQALSEGLRKGSRAIEQAAKTVDLEKIRERQYWQKIDWERQKGRKFVIQTANQIRRDLGLM